MMVDDDDKTRIILIYPHPHLPLNKVFSRLTYIAFAAMLPNLISVRVLAGGGGSPITYLLTHLNLQKPYICRAIYCDMCSKSGSILARIP